VTNKNKAAMLAFNLRKQTKDKDVLHCKLAKKRKDTKQSEDVGLIAEGLHNNQLKINNGQFNAHVTLDQVSLLLKYFRY
jgi:hypothetical protein